MILEFAIGSGDPNTAQVTVTATATKMSLDVPQTRAGLKHVFEHLVLAARFADLDQDQFFVLKTADTIGTSGFALLQDVSRKVLLRPMLVLDGGVTLASLTRSQLRTRMGLA